MAEFASLSINDNLPTIQLLVRNRDGIQIMNGPNSNTSSKTTTLSENDNKVELKNLDLFQDIKNLRICPLYSPNGNLVCFIYENNKKLSLHDTNSGQLVIELPIIDAEKAYFSPLGTYLITWSRPSKGNATEQSEGNLRIWDMNQQQGGGVGNMITSYSQKIYKPDLIQWTEDEAYCFRSVTNEIHIYNNKIEHGVIDKIYHKGLTQFSITPTQVPYISIAIFNREVGGNPARVTLYRYKPTSTIISSTSNSTSNIPNSTSTVSNTTPNSAATKTITTNSPTTTSSNNTTTTTALTNVAGPISSRTMFAATEAKLMWNSTGSALLIYAHSDVDASSYYGATGLFLMQAHTEDAIKVEQSKDGPVHDVQWSPTGDKFVIAAGTMPSHSTLFDMKGSPLYQYGAAHRNTILWSPHGRFLCIAGFGNLAGEMDFYDTLRSKKLGSNTSHCSTYYAWSPDSRYFMTASLAPRMNVDNNLKLFKYNGYGPIIQIPFERAYDVIWRPPFSVNTYPNRGPSPKKPSAQHINDSNNNNNSNSTTSNSSSSNNSSNGSNVVPVKPVVQPYRPPGSTGELASLINRETGPIGKVVQNKPTSSYNNNNTNNNNTNNNTTTSNNNTSNSSGGGKYIPSAQKHRSIPGMPPPNKNNTTNNQNRSNNNNNNNKPKPTITTSTTANTPIVGQVTILKK